MIGKHLLEVGPPQVAVDSWACDSAGTAADEIRAFINFDYGRHPVLVPQLGVE